MSGSEADHRHRLYEPELVKNIRFSPKEWNNKTTIHLDQPWGNIQWDDLSKTMWQLNSDHWVWMCGQNPKVIEHFTDTKFFNGDDTSATTFHFKRQSKILQIMTKRWNVFHLTSAACQHSKTFLVVATNAQPLNHLHNSLLWSTPAAVHNQAEPLRGLEGNACNIISCNWTTPSPRKKVIHHSSYSFEWWNGADKTPPEVTGSISLVQQRIHSALQEEQWAWPAI